MFIARKAVLNEYCTWLFPIVIEMIQTLEIKEEWNSYSKRIIGFWIERLLTVWLLIAEVRIRELPVILTDDGCAYGK